MECLNSIQEIEYPRYDVIVVDNDSSDGSQAFIRNTFPNVHLIENKSNMGVPEGQNIGIRAASQAEADYILTINNDTILDRNILRELVDTLEQERTIGVAGPILLSMEDKTRIENAGGVIDWNRGRVRLLNVGGVNEGLPKIIDVDYVSFFLADPVLLQRVGLFNKNYFAYWEDTDLCFRIKKAGCRVVCVSTAKVWHKQSYTSKRMNGFYEYQYARNQFWFWKAHSTRHQWVSFLLSFFLFTFWQRSIVILFRDKNAKGFKALKGFKAMCKGVIDGLLLDLQ